MKHTTPSEPTGRVSIRKNSAGLCAGYIGNHKVFDYDAPYNAKLWLAAQVMNNAVVSSASCFSAEDVEQYKALV